MRVAAVVGNTFLPPEFRYGQSGCGTRRDSIWPKRSVAEKRRMRAKLLYDFEVECRRQDWGDPAFVYDEERDLFRWTDGRFAFS